MCKIYWDGNILYILWYWTVVFQLVGGYSELRGIHVEEREKWKWKGVRGKRVWWNDSYADFCKSWHAGENIGKSWRPRHNWQKEVGRWKAAPVEEEMKGKILNISNTRIVIVVFLTHSALHLLQYIHVWHQSSIWSAQMCCTDSSTSEETKFCDRLLLSGRLRSHVTGYRDWISQVHYGGHRQDTYLLFPGQRLLLLGHSRGESTCATSYRCYAPGTDMSSHILNMLHSWGV